MVDVATTVEVVVIVVIDVVVVLIATIACLTVVTGLSYLSQVVADLFNLAHVEAGAAAALPLRRLASWRVYFGASNTLDVALAHKEPCRTLI